MEKRVLDEVKGENLPTLYGEIIFALFFIGVALLAYHGAMSMTSGTWYSPSVFPKLTSVLIISLCIYELVSALRKVRGLSLLSSGRAKCMLTDVIKHAVDKNVLFMILMIFLFAFILPILRFPLATMVFLFVCMVYYSEERSLFSVIKYVLSSAGFVLFSIVVFKTIFKVLLP